MKYFKLILPFCVLLLFSEAFSQSDSSIFWFSGRDFNKPFVSEISSPLNSLSFGFVETTKVSGRQTKKLTVNEVHLGLDIPVLCSKSNVFSWALSIPISNHMAWYPLEEITSPIINNDYRFGLSFTGHYKIENPYIKNISFEIKPVAHESTHLGDEFTISGFQDDTSFYRVNMSYEYYELSVTLNDPAVLRENALSLRFGFMGLIRPSKGYYSFAENEIGQNTLYPGKLWGEFYFGLNYKQADGSFANDNWQPNLSLELRNRIKYNYHNPEDETRNWCVNAYAGYCYAPKNTEAIKSMGHYIRYYNGVNPLGQFRNGTCYFIGYSLIINV